MDGRLLVVDLETVRDTAVLDGRWQPKDGKDDWPPPIGWKIIALGMVVAEVTSSQGRTTFRVKGLRCGLGDEREMLTKFWSYFENHAPTLVTFNGRRFDVPVLLHRAFMHGIRTPVWFQSRNGGNSSYPYRYSADRHCDLLDQLSGYGACATGSLDLIAAAVGLPGKVGGHGSEVEAMYEAGEFDRIAAYCECDVINLYALYVRWGYLTGRIGEADHADALADLREFLARVAPEKAHCAEFLAGWRYEPPALQAVISMTVGIT
jgi:predicted PolB exonuclease-like 3'-5' exonuclease